jgi:PTS system mannose-specific IIA component
MKQLGITAQDDPRLLLPQAQNMVRELDSGAGVLILTDMYGGTPSNMASKLVAPGKVEAVAGVSLPMLIRVLTYRDRDLQTIVVKAISGGCEGVMRVPMFKLHNTAS